ncbi:hypothetical protein HB664_18840 [Enterobacter sp. DNB-S2]|uniref:glycosyl hydrolase family 28-related protein n=1 Tax=Enterobacter sp. DNB-S2 TaxID=2720029 RepID=UPI001C62FCA0|nr:glycosyl hydrolase family 28-related protein [Enterobacter sp. DNB-S2]QYH18004.1 hypothetical protein HB664_18840 [Enterobacter sp. DNB-S2]
MSYSDTKKAQLYAAEAEVAAAECKLYTEEARKAPDYAAEARQAANDAAASSAQATVAASQANISANSASESASQALVSASEAASAGQTAAEAVFSRTLRVPDGETVTELQAASVRKDSVASFDDSGNPSSIPVNTIAILDSGGKIPVSMLPAIALTEPFVVSSQAAMLALNAEPGDIAKRTDKGYSFMLAALPPSTLANWVQLNDDILAQLALSTGAAQVGALDDNSGSTTVQGALNLKASTANLASVATGKGDALIGVKASFTGSVAMTQDDKNKLTIHVAEAGAKGDGINDDAPAINAAITYLKSVGGGRLNFGAGTYLCGSAIDIRGANISLIGTGIGSTIVKANFSGQALLNANESTDSRISPFYISGFTFDGNSTIQRVFDVRYRHYTSVDNCIFTGGTVAALYEMDTWLNTFTNCGFESSLTGIQLQGSNHRSAFRSCSTQGCTGYHIWVRSLGTVADGNQALVFDNCDVEFGTGFGVRFEGTSAAFNGCYIGENLGGSTFDMRSGVVSVNSGVFYWGYTNGVNGIVAAGGRITFTDVEMNAQSFGVLSSLASGTGGKVAFIRCTGNCAVGGSNIMSGDVLDYGPGPNTNFAAEKLGAFMSVGRFNTTTTNSVSGYAQTVTCATTTGTPALMSLTTGLSSKSWMYGKNFYFVIVYSSNVAVKCALSATAFGGTPSKTLIDLPSSGGAIKTAVVLNILTDASAYTLLEVVGQSVVVGSTFTVYECLLSDYRMLDTTLGNFSNIYKF